MTASFDLHMHSYWSFDSDVPPIMYFEIAKQKGLKCIAITDHYGIDGLPEFAAIAKNYTDIVFITAFELTVLTQFGLVDILIYAKFRHSLDRLKPTFNLLQKWNQLCGQVLCSQFQLNGIDYTMELREKFLRDYRPTHVIAVQGITRVAEWLEGRYLIREGLINDENDYYFLMRYFLESGKLPMFPLIESIKTQLAEIPAIKILAHPHRYNLKKTQLLSIINDYNLDGIECGHVEMDKKTAKAYRAMCSANNLLSTGGCDCHLASQTVHYMGNHLGQDHWLEEFLNALST